MSEPTITQSSYDSVAGEYADRFRGELAHKPFDRDLLDRFAEQVAPLGLTCDLGCGPGQVARYLHDRGAAVVGIDLSPGMVAQACSLNPMITFTAGDMRALPLEDDSLGGIAAFYSIIHIPRPDVAAALRELRRVLKPGGLLLLAFHKGDHVVHLDEWWEKPVNLDFAFFLPDEMAGYLCEAGFIVQQTLERAPYETEHPSQWVYIQAHKPGVIQVR